MFKSRFRSLVTLIVLFVLSSSFAIAQDGPDFDDDVADTPISGGILALLILVAAFIFFAFKWVKRINDNERDALKAK